MLGVLPETIGFFDDEVGNYSFPAKQTMRLKKVMGYNQHRLAKDTSTVSDFVVTVNSVKSSLNSTLTMLG